MAVARADPDEVAVPEPGPLAVDFVHAFAGKHPENLMKIVLVLLNLPAVRQLVPEQLHNGGGTEAELLPVQNVHRRMLLPYRA